MVQLATAAPYRGFTAIRSALSACPRPVRASPASVAKASHMAAAGSAGPLCGDTFFLDDFTIRYVHPAAAAAAPHMWAPIQRP
jgi:hypothetical protein